MKCRKAAPARTVAEKRVAFAFLKSAFICFSRKFHLIILPVELNDNSGHFQIVFQAEKEGSRGIRKVAGLIRILGPESELL